MTDRLRFLCFRHHKSNNFGCIIVQHRTLCCLLTRADMSVLSAYPASLIQVPCRSCSCPTSFRRITTTWNARSLSLYSQRTKIIAGVVYPLSHIVALCLYLFTFSVPLLCVFVVVLLQYGEVSCSANSLVLQCFAVLLQLCSHLFCKESQR